MKIPLKNDTNWQKLLTMNISQLDDLKDDYTHKIRDHQIGIDKGTEIISNMTYIMVAKQIKAIPQAYINEVMTWMVPSMPNYNYMMVYDGIEDNLQIMGDTLLRLIPRSIQKCVTEHEIPHLFDFDEDSLYGLELYINALLPIQSNQGNLLLSNSRILQVKTQQTDSSIKYGISTYYDWVNEFTHELSRILNILDRWYLSLPTKGHQEKEQIMHYFD